MLLAVRETGGAALGRGFRAVRHHRPATATTRRTHHVGHPQGRDRLAQGGPGDAHPLGEIALGRQRRSVGVDPQPDRRRQLLDAALEGVVPPHRSEDDVAEMIGRPSSVHRGAQGTSAGSMVRIGPLNHFFAETSHHTVIAMSTPMVTIGE